MQAGWTSERHYFVSLFKTFPPECLYSTSDSLLVFVSLPHPYSSTNEKDITQTPPRGCPLPLYRENSKVRLFIGAGPEIQVYFFAFFTFFRYFSHFFTFFSLFSLCFDLVIFASKLNKTKRNSSLFFCFFHFFLLFLFFFTFFRLIFVSLRFFHLIFAYFTSIFASDFWCFALK